MSPVLRRKLDTGTTYIDTDSAPRLIHFGEFCQLAIFLQPFFGQHAL